VIGGLESSVIYLVVSKALVLSLVIRRESPGDLGILASLVVAEIDHDNADELMLL
jgi:hypothetical protein